MPVPLKMSVKPRPASFPTVSRLPVESYSRPKQRIGAIPRFGPFDIIIIK